MDMKGLSEYAQKVRRIEMMQINFIKCKYNVLFDIVEKLSNILEKNIRCITDFKKIPCDELQSHAEELYNVLIENSKIIDDTFNIQVIDKNSTDYKDTLKVLRKLTTDIDYAVTVSGKLVSIIRRKKKVLR